MYIHCSGFILSAMTSKITGVDIVCSIVYSGPNKNKTKNIKAPREENPSFNVRFSSQRASDWKNVSIWWRHDIYGMRLQMFVPQLYLL